MTLGFHRETAALLYAADACQVVLLRPRPSDVDAMTAALKAAGFTGNRIRATGQMSDAQVRASRIAMLEAQLDAAKSTAAAAERATTAMDAETPAPVQVKASPAVAQLQEQLTAERAGMAVVTAKPQLEAAQAAYAQEVTQLAAQQEELRNANLAPALATGRRADALSVFGSFDGKAGVTPGDAAGARPSASLNLGKTFSTGVAAQILTDGLGRRRNAGVGKLPDDRPGNRQAGPRRTRRCRGRVSAAAVTRRVQAGPRRS